MQFVQFYWALAKNYYLIKVYNSKKCSYILWEHPSFLWILNLLIFKLVDLDEVGSSQLYQALNSKIINKSYYFFQEIRGMFYGIQNILLMLKLMCNICLTHCLLIPFQYFQFTVIYVKYFGGCNRSARLRCFWIPPPRYLHLKLLHSLLTYWKWCSYRLSNKSEEILCYCVLVWFVNEINNDNSLTWLFIHTLTLFLMLLVSIGSIEGKTLNIKTKNKYLVSSCRTTT